MMELEIGQRTDVGRRRDHNEDSMTVCHPRSSDEAHRRGALLVVADGMGGHAAGEVASRMAVETLGASYYEDPLEDAGEALAEPWHVPTRLFAPPRSETRTTSGWAARWRP